MLAEETGKAAERQQIWIKSISLCRHICNYDKKNKSWTSVIDLYNQLLRNVIKSEAKAAHDRIKTPESKWYCTCCMSTVVSCDWTCCARAFNELYI